MASMESLPPEAARDKEVWLHYGIKSALNFPLSAGGQLFGAVTFNTVREERAWPTEIVTRLTVVAQVFANALARKVTDQALRESMAENERLRERLQAESDYLKAEIKVTQAHGEVIGRSRAIRQVLSQVEQVAPTDSSVLIRGETGTGKELIAQAIHRLSPRQGHLMVKVNCAALPSALVESELFGREKGAFTGALTRQIGRFEVADGSTIFLDEISELSLEVQAKLLRVLQEGQLERLGSPKTIQRERPSHRGHQPRPGRGFAQRPLPGGSLLPAQRVSHPRAAAARAGRGHPDAGLGLPQGILLAHGQEDHPGAALARWRRSSAIPGRATCGNCGT